MTTHAQVWEVAQHLPHDEPLYRAIEMAVTDLGPMWDSSKRVIGRVLRPQPGVMVCPNEDAWTSAEGEHVENYSDEQPDACHVCGGSGTVPDPSEAGVVARDEACGRFRRVREALSMETGIQEPYERLLMALDEGYYDGVLAATLEAVRVLAAVEA